MDYISNTMIKKKSFQSIFVLLILFGQKLVNAQTHLEFGYSCGANATTSRTIKSDNMTWGYHTPPIPNTWLNSFSIGVVYNKNNISLVYNSGSLGPTWAAQGSPNKYPLQESNNSGETDISIRTSFGARSRANTSLSRISLVFKRVLHENSIGQHKCVIGLGYFQTRIVNDSGNFINSFFDDSLGWVNSGMVLDKYDYLRTTNYYITLGYEYSYAFGQHLLLNCGLIYNQGLYKMIKWHTYRTYTESFTGYSEYDNQWSFTRLSHFSLTIGVSYKINFNNKAHNNK